MIDALTFIGEPIQFTDKIYIYPPKIKEVLSDNNILQSYKVLTQSQEDIIDLLNEKKIKSEKTPTPLEFLLSNCFNSKQFETIMRKGLSKIVHDEVYIGYQNKIIFIGTVVEIGQISSLDQPNIITEENFFTFQNYLRAAFGDKVIEPYVEPDNPIVARIKAKSRERERRATKQKAKKGNSIINLIKAVCLMNCGITPFNVGDLPYCALQEMIKTYQSKEKYEKDMLMISGGADPKKVKPKYWLNFEEDQNSDTLKNLATDKQGNKKI